MKEFEKLLEYLNEPTTDESLTFSSMDELIKYLDEEYIDNYNLSLSLGYAICKLCGFDQVKFTKSLIYFSNRSNMIDFIKLNPTIVPNIVREEILSKLDNWQASSGLLQ